MDNAALSDIIAQAVRIATAPLHARITALERQKSAEPQRGDVGPKGERGEAGADGRDADPAVIAALHREIDVLKSMVSAKQPDLDFDTFVTKAAALVKPGRDGRDAVVDVKAIAAEAAALIPRPADGKDAPAVDLDVVALKAAALIPRPVDGKDAQPVDIEEVAVKAAALLPAPKDGKDGRDGVSLIEALQNQDGHLLLVMADGTTKDVGRIQAPPLDMPALMDFVKAQLDKWPKPKDGTDGKHGKDGLGFTDMTAIVDPVTKSFVHRYSNSERTVDVAVPTPMHVGIYSDDETYRKQHMVTRGGSVWLCLLDGVKGIRPDDKTADGQRAWLLVVQRGREGKQGPPGRQGPSGQSNG